MVLEKQLGNGCTWIDLDVDKIKNMEDLSDIYGLDKETIEYALDRNERAHMDYNRETETVTFIYNVLDLEKDKEYYEAIPMTFIVEKTTNDYPSATIRMLMSLQMSAYLDSHESLSILQVSLCWFRDYQ